ncbi:hypothetical protein LP414_07890 [Polaromonas sp. P1(28)-13]|nr:hypothetical protein LP414_07890 [Polaromonas sp. P1(28)-13]
MIRQKTACKLATKRTQSNVSNFHFLWSPATISWSQQSCKGDIAKVAGSANAAIGAEGNKQTMSGKNPITLIPINGIGFCQ